MWVVGCGGWRCRVGVDLGRWGGPTGPLHWRCWAPGRPTNCRCLVYSCGTHNPRSKIFWEAHGVQILIPRGARDTQQCFGIRTGINTDADMQHTGTGTSLRKENVSCRPREQEMARIAQTTSAGGGGGFRSQSEKRNSPRNFPLPKCPPSPPSVAFVQARQGPGCLRWCCWRSGCAPAPPSAPGGGPSRPGTARPTPSDTGWRPGTAPAPAVRGDSPVRPRRRVA